MDRNIVYTHHALDRFAQRFPDCNLVEEEKTLRKPSRSQVKKFLTTSKKSGASKKSNRLPNEFFYLVSQSECMFLCRPTAAGVGGGTLVVTVLH